MENVFSGSIGSLANLSIYENDYVYTMYKVKPAVALCIL